jgi:catechol 2,3-dioxygenase-like lactoylglutathione lyase family enzyme
VLLPFIELIVLRCADVERAVQFYSALGLTFAREQHDNGPVHYAAELGSVVLELYPSTGSSSGGLRLGLQLGTDVGSVHRALAVGGRLVRLSEHERHATVRDPDGHTLELRFLANS